VGYRPKSWGYQLQNADPRKIAKSKYGLVVIDYEQHGPRSFTSAEIKLMKAKGATKLVSYVSIGEAEDYRKYWKKGWSSEPPAWLERENPDWEGNYKVRYWQKDWQKLTIDRIKDVARAGYDGAYLDIIDAYEYFAPTRANAAKDMVSFVAKIAAAARKINPEFLIIPQNGEGLLKYGKYLSMIDGIGKEDLYYGVAGDGVRNEKDEIAYSRKFLDKATKAGKFVLSVEYLSDRAAVSTYLKDVAKTDYVPYVGSRDLDRITPPLSSTTKASKAADHDIAVLVGTAAADVIGGSDRDDRIEGRGGADTLSGGKGDDHVVGGLGGDLLWGGAGTDIFVFQSARDSKPVSPDVVIDFSHRQGDRMDLHLVDGNLIRSGREAFIFIGDERFSREAGELRYDDGILSGDRNGDGKADLVIKLANKAALHWGDLIL
jgi:cysteinyl-tRNA synthetase